MKPATVFVTALLTSRFDVAVCGSISGSNFARARNLTSEERQLVGGGASEPLLGAVGLLALGALGIVGSLAMALTEPPPPTPHIIVIPTTAPAPAPAPTQMAEPFECKPSDEIGGCPAGTWCKPETDPPAPNVCADQMPLFSKGCIGDYQCLSGLVFSDAPYDSVYSGVWGYNGILAAEAIMFFFVPSVRSVILSLLNAVFATMIQAALAVSLKQLGLPVFTFPFVISTLLLLATNTAGSGLTRVMDVRYPELHWRERPDKQKPDPESNGTPTSDPGRLPTSNGSEGCPAQGIGSPLPDSVIVGEI